MASPCRLPAAMTLESGDGLPAGLGTSFSFSFLYLSTYWTSDPCHESYELSSW